MHVFVGVYVSDAGTRIYRQSSLVKSSVEWCNLQQLDDDNEMKSMLNEVGLLSFNAMIWSIGLKVTKKIK